MVGVTMVVECSRVLGQGLTPKPSGGDLNATSLGKPFRDSVVILTNFQACDTSTIAQVGFPNSRGRSTIWSSFWMSH